MIAEFEQRLADILGTRLPAPLQGMVDVAPGRAEARVVLGVLSAEPMEESMLTRRDEVVPGSTAHRRVLRLRCEVGLEVRLLNAQTRLDQMRAFDRLVYALDESSLRTGAPLQPGDASDPGFLLQRLSITHCEPPAAVTLQVEGYFWPTDAPGQSGVAISQARMRLVAQPLLLEPAQPRLIAGGGAVDLSVLLSATGTMTVESDGQLAALPFGSVIVRVIDAGGRPGAGTLTGGNAAAGGARLLNVIDGRIALRYQPPAQAVVDLFVVALDNGEGGAGIELGRFPLTVRSA